MVSYLAGISMPLRDELPLAKSYPSFGSLMDFKLMYSSYSNVPLPMSAPLLQIV